MVFIIPITIARSSASEPQISFAQLMLSGPYGTAARWRRKANHFRPSGMFHMASKRTEKPPRKVDMDMIEARRRIASETMAKVTVRTS